MKRRSKDPKQLTFDVMLTRPKYGRLPKSARGLSPADIRRMTDEELLKLKGVGRKTAKNLRDTEKKD